MNKMAGAVLLAALAAAGCSSAPERRPMAAEYWTFSKTVFFQPEDLLSGDKAAREKAYKDFEVLTEESKEKVRTYLIYLLTDEKSPARTHMIIDALRAVKTGTLALPALIKAYAAATDELSRIEISQFISEFKPSAMDAKKLREMLGDSDRAVRLMALRILCSMRSAAAPAMPEILEMMRQSGPSYGLYAEMAVCASMISAEALAYSVSLDMACGSPETMESALRFAAKVLANSEASKSQKEILQKALVRVMYGGNDELSAEARKILSEKGNAEAVKKTSEFAAFKAIRTQSMKKLAAEKLEKRFREQLDDTYIGLKLFYARNGRQDAVKSIPDPINGCKVSW